MNRRRKLLAALGLCALAAPIGAFAQQMTVRRIGFLYVRSRPTPQHPDALLDAFVRAMRELGYVEGKNLVIEWRFADSKFERLPGLAAELIRLKPEVIVTHAIPAIEALKRATSSIPIVMTSFADPVRDGFVVSLARPGRNITGLSLMNIDLTPKRLELLKLIVPTSSRTAVLVNPGNSSHPGILKSYQTAGQQLDIKIMPVTASTPEEIERSFTTMRRERADAVVILSDSFFLGQRRQTAELATRNRMPSMFSFREEVAAGGLMSYGQNLVDFYRRAATYVDKILKGAKPGELPIEQPTKIHLAINLKTAKALGIAISKELLLRADEVIE
jgi:putative ABC transport system substrate-binding protein